MKLVNVSYVAELESMRAEVERLRGVALRQIESARRSHYLKLDAWVEKEKLKADRERLAQSVAEAVREAVSTSVSNMTDSHAVYLRGMSVDLAPIVARVLGGGR